jgi:hypothetical protein
MVHCILHDLAHELRRCSSSALERTGRTGACENQARLFGSHKRPADFPGSLIELCDNICMPTVQRFVKTLRDLQDLCAVNTLPDFCEQNTTNIIKHGDMCWCNN